MIADLEAAQPLREREQLALALFDLDGFKQYNDAFGHRRATHSLPRLGERLSAMMHGVGTAYRLGGDEFCVLAQVGGGEPEAVADLAGGALCERGLGFDVGCSWGMGIALMRADTTLPEEALRIADHRARVDTVDHRESYALRRDAVRPERRRGFDAVVAERESTTAVLVAPG